MLPTFSLTRLIARLLLLVPFAALVYYPSPGLAAGFAPSLGAAARFAALAGGAVTCTASTITGAVGYGAAFANTVSGLLRQEENRAFKEIVAVTRRRPAFVA